MRSNVVAAGRSDKFTEKHAAGCLLSNSEAVLVLKNGTYKIVSNP